MTATLLQFLSFAIFTFGAPAFCVLALSYWRERRDGAALFRIFTAACAVAFVLNLAPLVFAGEQVMPLARALVAAVLPVMMLHLVAEQEQWQLSRAVVAAYYGVTLAATCAREAGWSAWFDNAASWILAASSLLALCAMVFSRRQVNPAARREWAWHVAIFAGLFAVAVTALASDNPIWLAIPDALLVVFFAVRLYYSERLAFFDVFLKSGAYVAVGAGVSAAVLSLPLWRATIRGDSSRAWLAGLAVMPLWLLGPLLYARLSRAIDRKALGRKFAPADAERLFAQQSQSASSEEQLSERAAEALGVIFNCRARVSFTPDPPSPPPQDLLASVPPAGSIHLLARDNQIPFLSDDRRLLETLAATLGVILQNVRFLRREQELAALANRAELRALRAQINPHFLFNALNAIAGAIRTRPEEADETIAQLAEVFRYTLRRSQNEWVRLADEIDFVRAYLAVEKARFASRLSVSIEVDHDAMTWSVPAMIIQPIVENAIKHGTSRSAAVGTVTLTVKQQDSALSIDVTDSGSGFPAGFTLDGERDGHGLRNVRDRLRGYYGDRARLEWQNDPMGTRVRITITGEPTA